jgi:hypothetical protein
VSNKKILVLNVVVTLNLDTLFPTRPKHINALVAEEMGSKAKYTKIFDFTTSMSKWLMIRVFLQYFFDMGNN